MSALRLPPHSIEAEQSLLGGLLIDNTVWERVGDIVNEADFYRDDHRRIFRQIARLIELGKPADVVTVYEALEKNGEAEHVGGSPIWVRSPTARLRRPTCAVMARSFASVPSFVSWSPSEIRLLRVR
jgi:replicative DNA helicase